MPADEGVDPDEGVSSDESVAPDEGVPADEGVAPDAPEAPDEGAAPDAGPEVEDIAVQCTSDADCDGMLDGLGSCETTACDETGSCVAAPSADGSGCDDGQDCTIDDACNAGACVGQPVQCDDGNPCTDDACVADQGCTSEPNAAECIDGSACTSGDVCSGGSCAGTAIACDDAPPNSCADATTLIAYDVQGLCNPDTGACVYASDEIVCSSGCTMGACNGDPCGDVTCQSPPGPCFEAQGTCSGGSCSYAHEDGASCDDGLACTETESCAGGVCAGVPVVCADPPGPTCLDALTRQFYSPIGECTEQVGACSYETFEESCPLGCVAGQCSEVSGLSQADLTSGGMTGVSSGPWSGSCLVQTWDAPTVLQALGGQFTFELGVAP